MCVACVCVYACMYVCMHVCMCACMHVVLSCMRVCVYAYMHTLSCMCVSMYACIHAALSLNARLNRWSGKEGNLVRHYVKVVFDTFRWVCICFVR
jgi:hypothetical protein